MKPYPRTVELLRSRFSDPAPEAAVRRWTPTVRSLFLHLCLFLILPGFSTAGFAGNISVEASLSQSSATVGDAVDLEIKIIGARNGRAPRNIQVDGLSISYAGESTNVQMLNFDVTMSVTHSYSVLPQRTGTFTIPSQTVDVDGKSYRTQPLTLSVSSGANAASGGVGSGEDAQLAFAELVVPKSKAYVGEAIPIELRLYVDARIRWQMQQLPTIGGEGFTTQKLTDPIRNQASKNGRTYDLITFKTAVTPIKSGQLGLGPVEINCLAQIPQKRKRPRFATDDFDTLFNDPFGGIFTQTQAMNLKIDRNELEAVPLPPNPPKSFAGAVGTFTLASKASPTKANVGDPITLSTTISGRGNFDRVNAPKLMEEDGWRSYPPSNKFKADDDIGISGSKTFEMAIIPEAVHSSLPLVEFSYFDPGTERYVTLQVSRDPVVIAAIAPANTPAQGAVKTPASQGPTPIVAATPSPSPVPDDTRYILTGPTTWGRSFEPIYASKWFWRAQAIPMLGLFAFAAFRIRQNRKADGNAQRLAELHQQKHHLMQKLRNEAIDSKSFHEAAMQIIQLEVAASLNLQTPSSIGSSEACASRTLNEKAREQVRAIFNTCDEYRYAGSEAVAQPVSPEKRAEVLQVLKQFEKEQSHAS